MVKCENGYFSCLWGQKCDGHTRFLRGVALIVLVFGDFKGRSPLPSTASHKFRSTAPHKFRALKGLCHPELAKDP